VSAEREALERDLTAAHQAGAHADVAAKIVEGYGPEVLGFLTATLASHDEAQDVFQACCEDWLRGLEGFRRESSFRTWVYVIARRKALELRRRRRRHVPLSESPQVAALEDRARTVTAAYRRTDVKDSMRALRAQLSEDERMLLVLRIDRGMDWPDAARVLDPDEDPARAATRLRKRFSRLKDKIRVLAREEGMLDDEEA